MAAALELITGKDRWFEILEQIYTILKEELAEQYILSGSNELYHADVYMERSQPDAIWQDESTDYRSVVNVKFDRSDIDNTKSPMQNNFYTMGVYNIDIITASQSRGEQGSDELMIIKSNFMTRLVRSILFAEHYTYLGFPLGVILKKKFISAERFDADSGSTGVFKNVAVRLRIELDFIEKSPVVGVQVVDEIQVDNKDEADLKTIGANFT